MNRIQWAAALAAASVFPLHGHAQQSKIVEYSFLAGTDGNQPRGTLLPANNDTMFYGTTAAGGPAADGTVFSLVPRSAKTPAVETTLYTFVGGSDGSMPQAGLIADNAGNLYGTAALDGDGGRGTVFQLSPPAPGGTTWTEATLYSFTGHADGAQPEGSLIADNSGSGVLYGTTRFGGAHNLGVVFSLTPPAAVGGAWTEIVLFSFTGKNTGAYPVAALLQDKDGNLYGTASAGGSADAGTVFQLSPPQAPGDAWNYNVIYDFTAGADGANPQGTLIADATGALFGTAAYGGMDGCQMASYPYYKESPSVTAPLLNAPFIIPGGNQCGVVFKLTPPVGKSAWTEQVIYSFTGSNTDGNTPVSELLPQPGGLLYGTVPLTSATGLKGLLFQLTPPVNAGQPYTLAAPQIFMHEIQGTYPRAGVVPGPQGRLYGTNAFGGSTWVHVQNYGYGAIYGALP